MFMGQHSGQPSQQGESSEQHDLAAAQQSVLIEVAQHAVLSPQQA
jgi:hypothetical protein